MSAPIAIFYHCLLFTDSSSEPMENAVNIVLEQMNQARDSGLLAAATEFHVGINGGDKSQTMASVLFPHNASIVLHGIQCKNECRTIRMIEEWLPGHDDWLVLYFHSKGATHGSETDYGKMSIRWRNCMMKNCITRWRDCVAALESGFEAAGVHWLTGQADGTQNYFAGTFVWARASFLLTLPSIMKRERIKVSGLDSVESRYEAEIWIGNGPRLPRILDIDTSHGFPQCP